jgi:hypothetical protein
MRVRTLVLMAMIAIPGLTTAASAQDTPRVGVVMGYPAAIGVVWQVTDGIALRPEVTLTKNSGESLLTSVSTFNGTTTTSSSLITSDNWQAGFGLSALFYTSKHDALRTYVSPRWAYTRQTSSNNTGGLTMESTGNGNLVAGSFGAQYAIGARFSVFGEVGLAYSRTVNNPVPAPTNTALSNTTSRTFGARSGAGVVLYF